MVRCRLRGVLKMEGNSEAQGKGFLLGHSVSKKVKLKFEFSSLFVLGNINYDDTTAIVYILLFFKTV